VGFSKARFVLRRQTVSDPVRVQKHFLGAGILRVKESQCINEFRYKCTLAVPDNARMIFGCINTVNDMYL